MLVLKLKKQCAFVVVIEIEWWGEHWPGSSGWLQTPQDSVLGGPGA